MSAIKPTAIPVADTATAMVEGHKAILAAIDRHAEQWAAEHHGQQLASESGVLRAIMPAMAGQYEHPAVPGH
jgi:hypothetical protein